MADTTHATIASKFANKLVADLIEAADANAFAGSAHPEDRPGLAKAQVDAADRILSYIAKMEDRDPARLDSKPRKKLYGATFLGGALYGHVEPRMSSKVIKVSKVLKRLSKMKFETMNTVYQVYFVENGESTIPKEFQEWQ